MTVKFIGELGNNLFQLATLINLSKKYNKPFKLINNRDCYISIKDRPLELQAMFEYGYEYVNSENVKYEMHTSPDTAQIFEYTPIDLNPEQDTMIHGFFQSEKYFEDIKQDLLDVYFKPKQVHLDYINEKYSKLIRRNTLSIHVRVGGDRAALQHSHKNVSLDYYQQAIKIVLEKDPTVTDYVIFSDNINYCMGIFGDDENITYIKDEINYIDLFLMSMCKHNIVANSTFSWWGAYLNRNLNKIVVAPKTEWFGPALQHLNLKDLFPQDWITL